MTDANENFVDKVERNLQIYPAPDPNRCRCNEVLKFQISHFQIQLI